MDAIMAKGSYTESDARTIFCQIVSGLSYLHSRCEQSPRPAGAPGAARLGHGGKAMLDEHSVHGTACQPLPDAACLTGWIHPSRGAHCLGGASACPTKNKSVCLRSFPQGRDPPGPQAVQPAARTARRHHASENRGLWAGAQRGCGGGCRGSCRHPSLHGPRSCGGCPAGGWSWLHVNSAAGAWAQTALGVLPIGSAVAAQRRPSAAPSSTPCWPPAQAQADGLGGALWDEKEL